MAKSQAAQQLLASLDAELESAAKQTGRDLVWSAQEREVIGMIGAAVDRREELSEVYENTPAAQVRTRIALATEIRLIESSIERMLRHVKTDVPQPMSVVSQKAQRASRARWDRERMKQRAGG